jgi:hypothetical protein
MALSFTLLPKRTSDARTEEAGSRLSSAYMFTKVSGSLGKFLRALFAAFLRYRSEGCE